MIYSGLDFHRVKMNTFSDKRLIREFSKNTEGTEKKYYLYALRNRNSIVLDKAKHSMTFGQHLAYHESCHILPLFARRKRIDHLP